MKKILSKNGFNQKDIVSFGNMFLLGNGRYGYRGTLEEYQKDEMVALNVLGFYDRYLDKWRESLNAPNPIYFLTSFNDVKQSVLIKETIDHQISLNIYDATFTRESEFDDVIIKSIRFLSSNHKDLLVHHYIVKAKKDGLLKIEFKVDLDIYEINGPHYQNKTLNYFDGTYIFNGLTNENKRLYTYIRYISEEKISISNNINFIQKEVKKNEEISIFTYSFINQENTSRIKEFKDLVNLGYEKLLKEHILSFNKKWDIARVEIDEEESQFELDYSIYHLLILEDEDSLKSIPARGLSGQTYKGAIFWDTETFMLPFFTLINPKYARNLIKYRINTLKGAIEKAKSFNYSGAFYAWESQEDGLEQCSKYNVSDPVTNEPIRTYFDEKQIHISGDVVLGIYRYVSITNDYEILKEGAYEVIMECARFYMSRASYRDNQYHFDDVIGPDEYHERINDNAFTNYLVYLNIDIALKYYDEYVKYVSNPISKKELEEFKEKIYLTKANEKGIIEQFNGYFLLEDKYPSEVKMMAKDEKEYLGALAMKTKTIKQADVIALMILMPEAGLKRFEKENYCYYLPFTEHGSSLSSSMYSIAASEINECDTAYKFFRKSSGIDLGTDQKMYAGGIYIGGTHPASNAGAYLSVVLGFAGLKFKENEVELNPHLPPNIKHISFKFYFKGKLYIATINENNYMIKEAQNYD